MFDEILSAIPPGELLIVHASFKRCAQAGFKPENVIVSLLKRLGKEGTLMMPTFTYSYAGLWNASAYTYNPDKTPGIANGILSETFRKMPGVSRSNNPTYSVAAYGKYAEHLTSGSLDNAGLGHGSSYNIAMELGAKILLLNLGNNRNSMLHYIEIASGLPYNDIPFRECWGRTALSCNGEVELLPEFPACSEEFSKFDKLFVDSGISQKLGNSYLVDAQKMLPFVITQIKKYPDYMLCHNFTCEPCILRRKRLKEMNLI